MSSTEQREQYHYHPSKAAAVTFTVLFTLSTLTHIFQSYIFRRRLAWFMTPFVVGGICEIIGYVARILSSNDPDARTPYIIQTLLILLAPAFMAATIYMILGRIIQLTDGDKFALVRRNWLTGIFVTGDVISLAAQGVGGGMLTSDSGDPQEVADRRDLGRTIILVGLWIQIVFFGFFVLVSALFQFRGRHHLRKLSPDLAWKKHMYTLYTVSMLIFVRSVFRVIEYIQGVDGYLYSHEVYLYIFDATIMFIAMLLMNIVHPADIARLLKEKDSWGLNSASEMQRLDGAPQEPAPGYAQV